MTDLRDLQNATTHECQVAGGQQAPSSARTNQQEGRALLLALLIAAGLLLSYHMAIVFGIIPTGIPDSIDKVNAMKLEDFLLAEDPADIVVVGSSLSSIVLEDVDKAGITDLTFTGHSALDGVRLIETRAKLPHIIAVEAGSTLRSSADPMSERNISGMQYFLLSTSPIWRTKYQPTAVITRIFADLKKNYATASTSKPNSARMNTVKDWATKPLTAEEREQLTQNLKELHSRLRSLEKKRVKVILFRTPTDRRIQNLPSEQAIIQLVDQFFPAGQFQWLPSEQQPTWQTSDGMHLLKPDGLRYGNLLVKQLRASK